MKFITACLSLLLISSSIVAQQQRALVIGIDQYGPTNGQKVTNASGRIEWPVLDGCRNDAMAVKNEILLRWGFKNENIHELYDTVATRQSILSEINRLLNESSKGDIAFIFYAGHGSQVKNSKSAEQDRLDESLVPADAWKEGVEDIRDKTISALINKFIDKGIILTLIADCCHSGSLGRGFNDSPPKFRYIKASNQDVMDASAPPIPELRNGSGYLSISASQENEPAQEQQDDYNVPHGAFTVALLKALNQQSVDAPVTNLFNSTRAILKSNGKKQEPILAGSTQRLHGTLFGLATGTLPDKILIPVIAVNDSIVEFQGGFMAGLNIGNELIKSGSNVHVKITTMMGANRSAGKLSSGMADGIHPGELFEVSNWISSSTPLLKLYVPASNLSFDHVVKLGDICSQLKQSATVRWLASTEQHDPDVSLYYNQNRWMANDSLTGAKRLEAFSISAITNVSKGRFVYVNLPPPATLSSAIQRSFSNIKTIELTNNANDAQYVLSGTIDNANQLSYRWVKAQAVAEDSLEPMPLQTKLYSLIADTKEHLEALTANLYESSLKLSKIRAWLTLQAPHATSQFPFHLQVRIGDTNKTVSEQGVAIGDKLSIFLTAEENYAAKWDRKKKFIYVFLIDHEGNMSLIYPDENSGNLNNRYPVIDDKEQPVADIKLAEGEVTGPTGTDTYFMLATEEPIPDYSFAFNQQGVRGDSSNNNNNPLNDLINLANPTSRGLRKPITYNWNLEKTSVKTHH